jgi:hypothetical protein
MKIAYIRPLYAPGLGGFFVAHIIPFSQQGDYPLLYIFLGFFLLGFPTVSVAFFQSRGYNGHDIKELRATFPQF